MSQKTGLLYRTNGKKTGGLAHLSYDEKTPLCNKDLVPVQRGWKFRLAVSPVEYKELYGVCIKCFAILTGADVQHG